MRRSEADIRFLPRTVLPYHVNALTITAYGEDSATACASRGQDGVIPIARVARSLPRGRRIPRRVVVAAHLLLQWAAASSWHKRMTIASTRDPFARFSAGDDGMCTLPLPFYGRGALEQCTRSGLSIAELVRANELLRVPPLHSLNTSITLRIRCSARSMQVSPLTGILPGGLMCPGAQCPGCAVAYPRRESVFFGKAPRLGRGDARSVARHGLG